MKGNGRPRRAIEDHPAVPLPGLAGAGGAEERGGVHRLHRSGAQDQGPVRAGGTHYGALQRGSGENGGVHNALHRPRADED